MSWEIFEKAANRYETWYATPSGQRADRAERALLEWLLGQFPNAHSILEIGCGTGHFTTWFANQKPQVMGLDRSPAMVAALHGRDPTLSVIQGDAHHLPFRNHTVDVIAFVTTLEFLDRVELALSEAIRVARQGIILIVLNRLSVGGFSRRFGAQKRGALLGQAHDYSVRTLQKLMRQIGGKYIRSLTWQCALFPLAPSHLQAPIPFGDVIGMAAALSPA